MDAFYRGILKVVIFGVNKDELVIGKFSKHKIIHVEFHTKLNIKLEDWMKKLFATFNTDTQMKISSLNNYKVKSQGKGKTSLSGRNRLVNIDFCKSLPRDGLANLKKERQILIYTTKSNEKLFIQYPGKESILKNSKPWDFRPKLIKSDGSYLKDLEFKDIWKALFESFNMISNKDTLLRLLSTEFYRIAFMIDYKRLASNNEYLVRDVYVPTEQTSAYSKQIFHLPLNLYQPKQEIIELISIQIPKILDISWEGFLVYNDLLAFNEDCKYFYIGETTKNGGANYIGPGTGRINTILTHINIIGFLLDETSFSDILQQAGRTRGVAPASTEELKRILGSYLA